jgi:uncharacterized protein YecT (DUF1311 family)
MRTRVWPLRAALTLIALAAGAPLAVGQHMNAPDAACRDTVATSDKAACLWDALASRDKALSQLLGQIRPAVSGNELELLNRSQAAWMEYRRLSCDAEYAMYGRGTGGPVTRLACQEALTRDRLKQLHAAYDWRVEKWRWTVAHPNGR